MGDMCSRHNTLGQPSISYKVIRRFISSKEFETSFGLQLLANTLNDIIHNDRNQVPTLSVQKEECNSDANTDRDLSPKAKASDHSSASNSDASDFSENTVLYDMTACRDLRRCETKEVDVDKETFFSSSSNSSSSGDSVDGCSSSDSGVRGQKSWRKRNIKKEVEKKRLGSDAEDEELKKLLRMTDYSPSGRRESSGSNGEGGGNGDQRRSEKNNVKEKESEMSLLDCLDAAERLEEGSNPESEMQESDNDFLLTVNSEMKRTLLQSTDDSDEGSNEGEEGEETENRAEKQKAVEGEAKEKPKSGKKDELSEFRFPATDRGDEASDKSEANGEDVALSDANGEDVALSDADGEDVALSDADGEDVALSDSNSSDSVEYVQQVSTKRAPTKDDSKMSDTDSGSDIQQVYCKTQSPSSLPMKGRKNINKILKKDSLQVETKQALKMETERKKRVSERMKLFQEIFPATNSELILDFDPNTKEKLVVVDSSLVGQLKPHQKEGVRFMWNCCFESLERLEEDSGSGCVLAHCMGLGKSLQVITLVHTILTQNTGVHTVMVMCPLNTLRNWAHEFKIWLRDCQSKIKPVDLSSCKTKHNRMTEVRAWCEQGGVLLISYEMFRSLTKKDSQDDSVFRRGFLDPGPDLVVCDEGHVLKNNNSTLSKLISRIKTLRRIILTGTPLQNNLIEYYCMVQFVKPNILGTKREFLNRFVNPINNGQFEDSTQWDVRLMKRRAHVLHTMLDGFIQRCGYYVLSSFLPEKQEYVISIALTETQDNIYRLFIGRCTQENRGLFKDFHWMQRVWTHPRVMLMHSRKNGNEEAVPDQWERFVREEEYESVESSGKLLLLFSILKHCRKIGDKVLVFSQSLYSLDLIEFFLRKANSYHCLGADVEFADRWVLGEDYFRLDGSTSSDNREAYCQGFNRVEDGRARLFLISTRAGGLGINLVAANRVVVFDASWNPTHDVQSIFRVYRFGQKKKCYIYRFLAAATMEEKIYRRQVTKLSLAHRILDEHQIERHYTMGNLQELYTYDPVPKTEWRVPKVPKDSLFAEILASNRNVIVAYHEHDSLLENKEEEELSEEERRAAWEDYEKEKLTPPYPRMLPNGNPFTGVPIADDPRSSMHWLNSEGLRTGQNYKQGMMARAGPQGPLISQSGSDLCKIVEVRTLSGRGDVSGRVSLSELLKFSKAFGLKRQVGEDFNNYCQRVHNIFMTVFPWGRSGSMMRGDVNGVVGV